VINYHRSLVTWHQANGAGDPGKEADTDFSNHAAGEFADNANRNWHSNLVQSELLWRANWCVALAAMLLVLALLLYHIDFVFDPAGTSP
jgi:hypothetical protein